MKQQSRVTYNERTKHCPGYSMVLEIVSSHDALIAVWDNHLLNDDPWEYGDVKR
jgi:hypothetical protein